jgi:hypothetical protein
MTEQPTPPQPAAERPRVSRPLTLADLLPDCILPPEGKQHVRNARKEMLLAARSVLDTWISRYEQAETPRRAPTRIEVE